MFWSYGMLKTSQCSVFFYPSEEKFCNVANQKHLSLLSVTPVFLFCVRHYMESKLFFFPEINGELMIPLFPCCARKGGFGILFLIAQPLETDWSSKNTPSPLLPGLTMEALIFLIGSYAARGPAGIRSGLIILNKAKPLGLSVCLLFPMLSQWSVCSLTTSQQSKNTIAS